MNDLDCSLEAEMSQDSSPPPSLFKYLPARRAADFFECPTLRFSPPSALNDIFDLNPPIKELQCHSKELALLEYFSNRKKTGKVNTHDDLIEHYFTCEEEGKLNFTNGMSQLMEDKGCGILSLSSISKSLLMWAHYCDDHEGFVVELNTASEFFQPEPDWLIFLPLKKVEYNEVRPRISLLEIAEVVNKAKKPQSEQIRMFYDPVFFAKSKDWAYEEEWRAAAIGVEKFKIIPNNNRKPIIGAVPLPVEAIKSVILGARAKPDLVQHAKNFYKTHNKKIPIKRITPDWHRFKLDIDPFDLSCEIHPTPDWLQEVMEEKFNNPCYLPPIYHYPEILKTSETRKDLTIANPPIQVVPNPKGGWDYQNEGDSCRIGHSDTKREAVGEAGKLAKKQKTGLVIYE